MTEDTSRPTTNTTANAPTTITGAIDCFLTYGMYSPLRSAPDVIAVAAT